MLVRLTVVGSAVCALVFLACGGAETRPAEPPYEPTFSYAMPAQAAEKIDVTVGIIAPQFGADAAEYGKGAKAGDTAVEGMVRGLRTGFEALLTAKGFNTAGPFDSLDNMTFPEKKGCDFVLYPVIDVSDGFAVANQRAVDEGNMLSGSHIVMHCDVTLRLSGVVLIEAKEPLSGEKMWIKKIDIAGTPLQWEGRDAVCGGQKGAPQDIYNGWARAHEAMYTEVMSSLDRYVSAEEFQMLKRQAQELREKKAY